MMSNANAGAGAREHETEVRRTSRDGRTEFDVSCSCGWRGRPQETRAAAGDECLAHEVADA